MHQTTQRGEARGRIMPGIIRLVPSTCGVNALWFPLLCFKPSMIRQPFGVWKTGGASYEAEQRAASRSRETTSARRSSVVSFGGRERTLGFIWTVKPCPPSKAGHILIHLWSARVEMRRPEWVRRVSEPLEELRQVCAKVWPGGTCCPWVTNTCLPLIDCLVFYLWCSGN